MTPIRPPFVLTPLPGEAFDSWVETYAARLRVSTVELAAALGLPHGYLNTSIRLLLTSTPPQHLVVLASSTGLPPSTLARMFHDPALRPVAGRPATDSIRRSWSPTPGTRFCPTCLAGNGGRFHLAWRLPFTFLCVEHSQPLADGCPRCGRAPRARLRSNPQRNRGNRCAAPAPTRGAARHDARCATNLATARPLTVPDPHLARRAQLFINDLLTRVRNPDTTTAQRREAIDALTDLTVIAFHLAGPGRHDETPRRVQPHMLRADTLTTAVGLLTADHNIRASDPLTALVRQHAASPTARAIPESWRTASPTLTARITHHRDASMTPIERLRYASTLPSPTPRSDPDNPSDPAIARAARLPDQIWSAWAVRLLADDTLDPTQFRQAAAVALLLPHSNLRLAAATALISAQISHHNVQHQMRILAKTPGGATALRILTELSMAIDRHDLPINYARRRHLAATTDLIDAATWRRLAHQFHHFKGSRRRLEFARRYLYELLTAGNLAIAPHPYTLPHGILRFEYHDFVLGLPAGLVTTLAEHATDLLNQAGINEPLQWHPPTDWITVHDWPGADPDHTDPAPIHQDLISGTTPSHVAKSHGLSTEHLRYLLRHHPLPGKDHRTPRRGTILPLQPDETPPPHAPGVHYIDPAWLREQYITWQRTLRGIATEIGCTTVTLMNFAKQHHIPLRPRSGGNAFISQTATTVHPADLPDLLRTALTGQRARQRVERFLLIAEHRNLRQAAEHGGGSRSAYSMQLTALERQCGGDLIGRGAPRLGELTPLGQQLRQQAMQHLLPAKAGPR
jgi:hypothetical protein